MNAMLHIENLHAAIGDEGEGEGEQGADEHGEEHDQEQAEAKLRQMYHRCTILECRTVDDVPRGGGLHDNAGDGRAEAATTGYFMSMSLRTAENG